MAIGVSVMIDIQLLLEFFHEHNPWLKQQHEHNHQEPRNKDMKGLNFVVSVYSGYCRRLCEEGLENFVVSVFLEFIEIHVLAVYGEEGVVVVV